MEITKGHDGLLAISSLDDEEIKWWRKQIGKCRKKHLPSPKVLVGNYFRKIREEADYPECIRSTSNFIQKIRDDTWKMTIDAEVEYYKAVTVLLFKEKPEIQSILAPLAGASVFEDIRSANSIEQKLLILSGLFGNFTGRIFPYLYEMSKSGTQSRRARAGKVFELIISEIMQAYGHPYDSQSKIGKKIFKAKGLGKMVDGILPSMDSYDENRQKCMVVTMKTTLRERWQQVVEELARTTVPSIYLLTLDEDITHSGLDLMKNHNITLVTYEKTKNLFPDHTNIISFESFFNQEIPHVLTWWNSR